MEDQRKTLYLEINNVQPHDYLKDLRVALLHLLRLHFEGKPEEVTEEEQYALFRITDFLIMITKGDLNPIEFKSRGE